ncbi:MAG: SPOR domain-containing protein [Deltaproteobacteria bacterium]|jgi:hypothetical protein|nr:SPOR domain-containing protein [Deltaproteobacteria bacterium]
MNVSPPHPAASPVALACAAAAFLSGCGWFGWGEDPPSTGAGGSPQAAVLGVDAESFSGGVAPADYGLLADFFTVWCGSYTEEAPARAAAAALQREGLTSFALRKTLEEKRLPFNRHVGDYWLLLAGLFGERDDAEALGSRLVARGLVANYQVIPTDRPDETASFETQTSVPARRSEAAQQSARERLAKPIPPDSPSATGEGFKRAVTGRYIGSFRDEWAARAEARRLTSAGWPAAVEGAAEGGGLWYRVYLIGPGPAASGIAKTAGDAGDYRTAAEAVAEAKTRAASQRGLFLVVDTAGLKGAWGGTSPSPARTDASSCAGYSQAGRLLASIERLASYIPDAGLLVSVRNLGFREEPGLVQRLGRSLRSWWTEDGSAYSVAKPAYGPAIFNRPEVLRSIRNMKPDVRPAPVGPGLARLGELETVPGRKAVVLFSDFSYPDTTGKAEAAAGGLRGQYGEVDLVVVYGDSTGDGWRLAQSMARAGGSGEAWDGCRLLADNAYFERFIKRVFPR